MKSLQRYLRPYSYVRLLNTYMEAYRACRRQWDAEELEQVQAERLQSLVKHAYENVEFYQRRFNLSGLKPQDIKNKSDLVNLPPLTKQELVIHFPEIVSLNLDIRKCRISKTSGSTGTPTLILKNRNEAVYTEGTHLRYYLACGVGFGDKILHVTASLPSRPYINYLLGLQRIHHFPIYLENWKRDPRVKEHLLDVKQFNPHAIHGVPHLLRFIARAVRLLGISGIRPRVITSSFELLDEGTRKYISETFNCDVIDFYGSSEVNGIAWECPKHEGYHVNVDNVIVEILKEGQPVREGEFGEVVVTYLHNYATPLIRYKIGDLATYINDFCSCGRKLPLLIKNIEGRKDALIVLPDGRVLLPDDVIDIMDPYTEPSEYQIIQESKSQIIVKYANSLGFSSQTVEEIKNQYRKVLGNEIDIKLVEVDRIQLANSRKLRTVVSKVSPF